MNSRFRQALAWLALGACSLAGSVQAAGDMTAQEPVEIRVNLGDRHNNLRFFPDQVELETGKLYKLVLHNPSDTRHIFSSEGLARLVFTRKVQMLGADGKPLAIVRGRVREVEVMPSGSAEWWFVPVKTAKLKDLRCSVDGHAQAGMVGRIHIK